MEEEQSINESLQNIEVEHEKKVFSQMVQNAQELELTISNIEEKTFFIGRRGEREVLDNSPMQRALFPEDLGIAVLLGDQELSYLDFEPDHQNGIRIYYQLGNTQSQNLEIYFGSDLSNHSKLKKSLRFDLQIKTLNN